MEKRWKYSGEIALFLVVVFLIVQLITSFQPSATGYAVRNNSLDGGNTATFKFDAEFKDWDRVNIIITNEDEEIYLYNFKLDLFSFFATSGKVVADGEEGGSFGFLFWILVVFLISGIVLVVGGITHIVRNKKNFGDDFKRNKKLGELKNLEVMDKSLFEASLRNDKEEKFIEEEEEPYIFRVSESRIKPRIRRVKIKKDSHKNGVKNV